MKSSILLLNLLVAAPSASIASDFDPNHSSITKNIDVHGPSAHGLRRGWRNSNIKGRNLKQRHQKLQGGENEQQRSQPQIREHHNKQGQQQQKRNKQQFMGPTMEGGRNHRPHQKNGGGGANHQRANNQRGRKKQAGQKNHGNVPDSFESPLTKDPNEPREKQKKWKHNRHSKPQQAGDRFGNTQEDPNLNKFRGVKGGRPAPGGAAVLSAPTVMPVTPAPTLAPVTSEPTLAPVTPAPTMAPVTPEPTAWPTSDATTSEPTVTATTEEPTSSTTSSTYYPTFLPTALPTYLELLELLSPVVIEIAQNATESLTETHLHTACPPAYDTTREDYIAGDTIEVEGHIFQCHWSYEEYCNVAEWDDSLLEEDANAEEYFNSAWTYVAPCETAEIAESSL